MRKELTPSRKRLKKATGDRPTVVCGFKAVQLVEVLLQGLPDAGTQRDRAGNPQLVYDQYATLLLLYFFTPTVTRLRGIQPRSELTKVQQCWGVRRTALSTRSEAATVFDATLLRDGSSKLALRAGTQVPPGHPAVGVREQDFFRDLSAIAGSLLPTLPRRVWAVWQDEPPRAAKRRLAVAAPRQVPVGVPLTADNGSERARTRQLVQPGDFTPLLEAMAITPSLPSGTRCWVALSCGCRTAQPLR